MTRRVHLAGRGAVSGFGTGVAKLVDGIWSGERCVRARRRTTHFVAPTEVAAEFPSGTFDGLDERDDNALPFAAAVIACEEALLEAGLGASEQRATLGLLLATTKAELSGLVGPGEGYGLPIRLAQRVAGALELGGTVGAISTACTSGLSALAMAERRIAIGEVDRMLVVGTDALNQFIMAGFGSMGILDRAPCRPFDGERRGISLGDGAAAIVLSADERESLGVSIAGHGGANDAASVTGCHREGRGVQLAVERSLEHAGLTTGDIDVVHLHGTATRANDYSEATGLGIAFGGATPPAFGTKAQTGHTLGAAGLIETVIALAALERGNAPPNVGLDSPNVDARLSLVRAGVRLDRARYALKVSGGFGGIQQAMVFEA